MKILHVITSLRTGGAEKLMVDLLPRMRKLGHEVDLLVFDGVQTPFMEAIRAEGINVYALRSNKSVYDFRNIYALRKYLKQYDIVHTHNTACQYYVALASKLCRANCLLVTTEHSTSNRRREIFLFKALDNWMYHQYKKIITVSDISSQNIKDYTGDPEIPTLTIANGIDYEKFASAEPLMELQEKYKNCHCGFMVAGFRYEKDHPTVIKAYAQLPSVYHLFLVGDGARRYEYESLVKELSCADRIHFLGIRSDVPSLLKTGELVIMSSHREGLSLSSLEGMASGRPFISSDVDGLHEITQGYGILFPHEDVYALANTIYEITNNSQYYSETVSKCEERAKQFDISITANLYVNVYESLIVKKK